MSTDRVVVDNVELLVRVVELVDLELDEEVDETLVEDLNDVVVDVVRVGVVVLVLEVAAVGVDRVAVLVGEEPPDAEDEVEVDDSGRVDSPDSSAEVEVETVVAGVVVVGRVTAGPAAARRRMLSKLARARRFFPPTLSNRTVRPERAMSSHSWGVMAV